MNEQKPKSMIEIIKEAGYVMVVRCKDCKYKNNPINCKLASEGMYQKDDWYCADGEKI